MDNNIRDSGNPDTNTLDYERLRNQTSGVVFRSLEQRQDIRRMERTSSIRRRAKARILAELQAIKQGLVEYQRRVSSLTRNLSFEVEEEARNQVIDGLSPVVRNYVWSKQSDTSNEAVDKAKDKLGITDATDPVKKLFNVRGTKIMSRCNYCQLLGHKMAKCPRSNKYCRFHETRTHDTDECKAVKEGQNEIIEGLKQPTNNKDHPTRFKCQETGHTKNECQRKLEFCTFHKTAGHNTEKCRAKQRQEIYRNQRNSFRESLQMINSKFNNQNGFGAYENDDERRAGNPLRF